MRRIEVDDRFRQTAAADLVQRGVAHACFQRAQQGVLQGAALGQQPDTKGRIKILEAGQKAVGKPLRRQQRGVDFVAVGLVEYGRDIDLDAVLVEFDFPPFGTQTVKADIGADLAQFTQRLAQRGARLVFPGLAPQQADQAFPRFQPAFTQRDIRQRGTRLHALDAQFLTGPCRGHRAEQRQAQHRCGAGVWRITHTPAGVLG